MYKKRTQKKTAKRIIFYGSFLYVFSAIIIAKTRLNRMNLYGRKTIKMECLMLYVAQKYRKII